MIQRIEKIDNYRVFHGFHWPDDLENFNKYNLIYGWNGSGKTALSSIFRAIELQQGDTLDGISLKIDDSISLAQELNGSALPIKVFNRDFVQDSVFPVGGGELAHIFILGKESVEKQKEVQRLEIELEAKQSRAAVLQECSKQKAQILDKYCINKASAIKKELGYSGGSNPYSNYDRRGFVRKVTELLAHNDINLLRLTDEQYKAREEELRDNPKDKMPRLALREIDFDTINQTISELLGKTVISYSIDCLKNDPDLSAWVQSGLEMHRQRQSSTCLFCNQSMPELRIAEIEKHFNDAFNNLQRRIDEEIGKITKAKDELEKIALPDIKEFYPDIKREFTASRIKGRIRLACKILNKGLKALRNKKNLMFEAITYEPSQISQVQGIHDIYNNVISHHNDKYDRYEKDRSDARGIIEAHLIASNIEEYKSHKNDVDASTRKLTEHENDCESLKNNIRDLRRSILQHHKPAEDLNKDLCSYLGHNEIQLETKDAGYQITRGGVVADGLSEGEKTAIALLYFLRTLDDRDFNLQDGIVVLDDPISSLDANALFSAFGFIKARTENAKQLFILTHNFTFFSQVRYWFKHVKKDKKIGRKPVAFYMLKCLCDGQQRKSAIKELDSLLKDYNSEYHYLFSCVYKASISEPSSDLQKNYMLPNHARRVIEAFLAFKQPIKNELYRKFKDISVDFDPARKVGILRFLHTFSHNDSIAESEHDLSPLSESEKILCDMIDLMKAIDREHVDSMIELINRA